MHKVHTTSLCLCPLAAYKQHSSHSLDCATTISVQPASSWKLAARASCSPIKQLVWRATTTRYKNNNLLQSAVTRSDGVRRLRDVFSSWRAKRANGPNFQSSKLEARSPKPKAQSSKCIRVNQQATELAQLKWKPSLPASRLRALSGQPASWPHNKHNVPITSNLLAKLAATTVVVVLVVFPCAAGPSKQS